MHMRVNEDGTVNVREGETILWRIYGHVELVKVLRAERWSMDVERLSDGRCFRVSGIGTGR